MKISVVVSGRSYDQLAKLPAEIEITDGATLDDALDALAATLPEGEKLPASCLVAVGQDHMGTISSHDTRPLREGEELVLLAPVAGG